MEYIVPEADIEIGRWLFSGECRFIIGAVKIDDIPAINCPEIGFIGSSNVGKSSLINALTSRKTLAKVSHTPGRTRQLNFFLLREKLCLVDMPGYGYAEASKKSIQSWSQLIHDYLKGRSGLKRVFILVDSRRGVRENDFQYMTLLDNLGVSYQIILTKIDKCKKHDLDKAIDLIKSKAPHHVAMHPFVITVSSRDGTNLEYLRAEISAL